MNNFDATSAAKPAVIVAIVIHSNDNKEAEPGKATTGAGIGQGTGLGKPGNSFSLFGAPGAKGASAKSKAENLFQPKELSEIQTQLGTSRLEELEDLLAKATIDGDQSKIGKYTTEKEALTTKLGKNMKQLAGVALAAIGAVISGLGLGQGGGGNGTNPAV